MTAIDFEGINAAALRNGRSLVQDFIPGGKFRRLEYVVKNPCRNDERPGSFSINYRTAFGKTLRRTTAARTLFLSSLM